jgi:hypothetical protein
MEKGTKFLSGVFDDWQPPNASASPTAKPAMELKEDDIPF